MKEVFLKTVSETKEPEYISIEGTYCAPTIEIYSSNHTKLCFDLQTGAIKEVVKNGCDVTDVLRWLIDVYVGFDEKFPCDENTRTIRHLRDALTAQDLRTIDREERGVEGLNAA